jgi:transcriptional regulator with XRE-family HTH domain
VVSRGFSPFAPVSGPARLCRFGNADYALPAVKDWSEISAEIGRRMRVKRQSVYGRRSISVVARHMNVSPSDISRWERNKRTLSLIDFIRFARAIGVAPEKLLSGIAPAAAEQQVLPLVGLDAPAETVVRKLVDLLRERARRRSASTVAARRRAS